VTGQSGAAARHIFAPDWRVIGPTFSRLSTVASIEACGKRRLQPDFCGRELHERAAFCGEIRAEPTNPLVVSIDACGGGGAAHGVREAFASVL